MRKVCGAALLVLGVAGPARGATLATMATASGDGGLTITVDGYGTFGTHPFTPVEADAVFDPLGGVGPKSTTYDSSVYLDLGASGVFLTSGVVGPSGNGALADVLFDATTGTSADSAFDRSGLHFELSQRLVEAFDGSTRIGTILLQEYTVTNTTAAPVAFDLVRYFDGDLLDGETTDGGGRVLIEGEEFLFETDVAGAPTTETSLVGVTACGGTVPTTGRYQVWDFPDLVFAVGARQALTDTVWGDGADADQLVDTGQDYDVTLALANSFTLAAGAGTIYTATTLFGTLAPSDASDGCALFVDSDHDGVPDDDDQCPGHDDTPDPVDDFDDDGVHDACDECPLSPSDDPADCISGVPDPTTCTGVEGFPPRVVPIERVGVDLALVVDSACWECLPDHTSKGVFTVHTENRGSWPQHGFTRLAYFPDTGDVEAVAEFTVFPIQAGRTEGNLATLDLPATPGAIYVAVTGLYADADAILYEDVDPTNNYLFVTPAAEMVDSDADGWADDCDPCRLGHWSQDADADGTSDACDGCSGSDDSDDYDLDGFPDACDPCPLLSGVQEGAECTVTNPGSHEMVVDCRVGPDPHPSHFGTGCGSFRFEIRESLPCRDCDDPDAEEVRFFVTIGNSGTVASPESGLHIFREGPAGSLPIDIIAIPALDPGEGTVVGPLSTEGWWRETDVVLAQIVPGESALPACHSTLDHILLSPPADPACFPLDPAPCPQGMTVGPAGGLPALVVLWLAMAGRRRRT